jgi:TnpA family transposase
MARREYLPPDERSRFDTPPVLTSQQRSIFLDLPAWATNHLKQMVTPTNQVGFLLQLGYFRVVGRFFVVDRFHLADIDWLSKQLQLGQDILRLTDYAASQTVYRHRQLILYQLGYEAFAPTHRQALQEEAARLTHLQTKPARMLDTLVNYLMEHRIEVPPYNTLRDILTEALNALDDHMQNLIEEGLTTGDRAMLDALLENSTTSEGLESTDRLSNGRFPLTRLKHISQSMQRKQIAERVALFRQLKDLFSPLAPLIERLGLSDDTIRYYAQYVLDNRSGQLAERVHERYLRLLAFITYQYLSVGDALILTLNKAVASILNSCEQTLKEQHYQSRYATAGLVGQVSRRSDVHIDTLTEIERTIEQSAWNSDQKINHIRDLLTRRRLGGEQLLVDKQRLAELKMLNQPLAERADFYLALEKAALRLQVRVSGLIQVLVFEAQTTQSHLLTAICYFQERAGDLPPSPALPIDFLDMADRQQIFTAAGRLRISLYKVLLFRAVRDALRDGSLTVLSSYEYRSVDEYQIPQAQWQLYRDDYLQRANLLGHREPGPMLVALSKQLNTQFKKTNEHLATNAQVYLDTRGGWHLHRYQAQDSLEDMGVRLLYPTARVISLRDVLSQVNRLTGFLGKFVHKGFGQKPTPPDERLLLAAIIGYGENIGIRKMGMISKSISVQGLERVATQYFSPEMTLEANDCIVAHSEALPLTDLFRRKEGFVHTGSDGQKYDVSVPSLRASASFKYFGNGEGMSVYSGLDEAGQLIYSVAFNAADRESPYVLDVMLYNEVIQSDAHATDMHGFSEPNFALAGLYGLELRPRFVSIHSQQLYSLDAVSTFKEAKYTITPHKRIDYEHLVASWDDLLRLGASVKLGFVKASTILKRLNSYARQHPLYRALKDLGRLYKTDYILRYVDESELRETVEGMLTKVEHSNKFSSAVILGNNQAFGWQTPYEQDIAQGCRRLIMNAINFYNLLYLSEKLRQCATEPEREELLKTILSSSTHTWHHINLQGEYDFSEPPTSEIPFDWDTLLQFSLPKGIRRR